MDVKSIYAEAIEKDEPITIDGFTLYPILVRDYRKFEAAHSALLLRQGSLPVEYAVMSYLGALYALDLDAYKKENTAFGLLQAALTILALAMRFPVDAVLRQTKIEVSDRDERQLVALRILAGDTYLRLTPAVFDRIRPVLAAQNGLELPDETENADLVESEMDIAAKNASTVEPDFHTLLASVARDQRCRQSELMEYTIREFSELREAIERDKMFMLYQTAELSGTVKFTKGNPCPSWCYARKEKANSLISMATFMAGPGSVATMK